MKMMVIFKVMKFGGKYYIFLYNFFLCELLYLSWCFYLVFELRGEGFYGKFLR